jgi:ABC-type uncharacterized transport system substrate-binding protein
MRILSFINLVEILLLPAANSDDLRLQTVNNFFLMKPTHHDTGVEQARISGSEHQNSSLAALLKLIVLKGGLITALLLALLASPVQAAAKIAVVYPDVSASYQNVFQSILDGINSQQNAEYQLYPLDKQYDLDSLKGRLKNDRISGVIALGKRGYLAAKELKDFLPTVVGALPLVPDGTSGISLSSDPDPVFARLKTLVPDARQVNIVYSPQFTGWLIPLAEKAAKKYHLLLNALPAENLREAMNQYRDLVSSIHGRTEVIWLPLDTVTAREDVVLPMLLKEAWDRDLVLCSSKPLHVQQGVLFSMYPDNFALGMRLSQMLQQRIQKAEEPLVVPMTDLQLAVNLRTAAHLGLQFDSQLVEQFNLTFPSR